MNKFKFTENIWITFILNDSFFVGRTIIRSNIELVASTSETGDISYVLYSEIENPKKLKLLKDEKFKKFDAGTKKDNLDFNTRNN